MAREKGIELDIVLAAMSDAIEKAAKARYGMEMTSRVEIDPKTGNTRLLRVVEVVDVVENDDTQIPLALAQRESLMPRLVTKSLMNCHRLSLAALPPNRPSK